VLQKRFAANALFENPGMHHRGLTFIDKEFFKEYFLLQGQMIKSDS